MPRGKTRPVSKSDYGVFLAKANQFLSTMEQALTSGQWDSVGLQGVHVVISTSDALLAFYGGVKSAEPDHKEVIGLLQETLGVKFPPAINRHVSSVIAKKHLVEYEQRRLTGKEAGDLADHARRFVTWAKQMLPERIG